MKRLKEVGDTHRHFTSSRSKIDGVFNGLKVHINGRESEIPYFCAAIIRSLFVSIKVDLAGSITEGVS